MSFAAEASVIALGTACVDVAATYKASGGDMAVAWAQIGAGVIGLSKRTAGVWGGGTGSPGAASWSGVAMHYVLDWEIAATGVETDDEPPDAVDDRLRRRRQQSRGRVGHAARTAAGGERRQRDLQLARTWTPTRCAT